MSHLERLIVRDRENTCQCFKLIEDLKYMQCGDCDSLQSLISAHTARVLNQKRPIPTN